MAGARGSNPEPEIMNTDPKPAPAAAEPYITKNETARRLGKTLRTVDNWMRRGLLPYYKIGRTVVFKWSDVEASLAQSCRVVRR